MLDQKIKSKNTTQKIVNISLLVCFSLILFFLITGIFSVVSRFFYGVFGLSVFAILIAASLFCVFNLLGKKIAIKYRYIANFIVMYFLVVLLVHAVTSTVFIEENTDFSAYISDCYKYVDNKYSSATFGGVLSGIIIFPIYKTLTGWGLYAILIIGLLITVFVATNFLMKYYSDSRASLFFETVPSEKKNKQSKLQTTPIALKMKSNEGTSFDQESDSNKNNIFNSKQHTQIPVEINNSSNFTPVEPTKEVAPDQQPQNSSSAYGILYGDITSKNLDPEGTNDILGASKPKFDVSPTVNFNSAAISSASSNDSLLEKSKNSDDDKSDLQLTYTQSSPRIVRPNPIVGKYNTTPIINAEYLAMQKQLEAERKNIASQPVVEPVKISTVGSVSTINDVSQQDNSNQNNDVFMEVDASEFKDIIINPIKKTDSIISKPQGNSEFNIVPEKNIINNSSNSSALNETVNNPAILANNDRAPIITKTTDIDAIVPKNVAEVEIEEIPVPEENVSLQEVENKLGASKGSSIQVSNGDTNKINIETDTKKEDEDEFIVYQPYNAPDLSLLDSSPMIISVSQEECNHNREKIESTLEEFKIPARVVSIVMGPTVTRYELSIGPGVSVNKLPNLANDMAVRLAASEVRWEIPIPGKELVGLEVPNKSASKVPIREILASPEFQRAEGDLSFAVGIDINGRRIVSNIAEMPHMLVAGGSGSGKSVSLNALIVSLLYKYSPEELRLVLIDPKLVEFIAYEELPHLMVNEIISEPDKIVSTFKWLITEMERRYKLLRGAGVLDIAGYNNVIDHRKVQRLPRIVVIVDELADIMASSAKADVETCIMRLAQKARAAGIHLILAMQRPSVQVVNGNIKNNFGYRIALKVGSNTDSRTILDTNGAEKLLGKGDMLFKVDTSPDPIRLQGAFISKEEVDAVVAYVKENNEVHFSKSAEKRILKGTEASLVGGIDIEEMENDPEFIAALKVCLDKNKASTSSLQSILRIGWNKALRIMEAFEALGYVSPQDGSKPRQLFITREEFEEKYGGRS